MDISVIVPLYKGNKYVPNIYNMVFRNAQNAPDCEMELILVNDFPGEPIDMTDCGQNIKVRLIDHSENMGIHGSRVSGLKAATGRYILILDQDDCIDPMFVYSQMHAIGDADACICNGIYRGTREIIPDEYARENVCDKTHYAKTLEGIISPGQALIKRTSLPGEWIDNILRFNYCDDAFLWLLMKDKDAEFVVNMNNLYVHNETDENTSYNWSNNAKALTELKKVITERRLLSADMENLFLKAVDAKIKKHETYAKTQERLSRLEENFESIKISTERSVAVYGCGVLGKQLIDILRRNDIKPAFLVDSNIRLLDGMAVLSTDDIWPDADLMIVTPVLDYDNIRRVAQKKGMTEVVSLLDI